MLEDQKEVNIMSGGEVMRKIFWVGFFLISITAHAGEKQKSDFEVLKDAAKTLNPPPSNEEICQDLGVDIVAPSSPVGLVGPIAQKKIKEGLTKFFQDNCKNLGSDQTARKTFLTNMSSNCSSYCVTANDNPDLGPSTAINCDKTCTALKTFSEGYFAGFSTGKFRCKGLGYPRGPAPGGAVR